MITEPIAMNLFFVNFEGARLIQIDGETAVPEVHIELVREDVDCTTCGVAAVVKDRRLVPEGLVERGRHPHRVLASPGHRPGEPVADRADRQGRSQRQRVRRGVRMRLAHDQRRSNSLR